MFQRISSHTIPNQKSVTCFFLTSVADIPCVNSWRSSGGLLESEIGFKLKVSPSPTGPEESGLRSNIEHESQVRNLTDEEGLEICTSACLHERRASIPSIKHHSLEAPLDKYDHLQRLAIENERTDHNATAQTNK